MEFFQSVGQQNNEIADNRYDRRLGQGTSLQGNGIVAKGSSTMKSMCVLITICLLLSGCGAIEVSKNREHIALEKAQRTTLIARLKADDPDNWHEMLLEQDISAIAQRRQRNLGLKNRMLWIQYETDVLIEDSKILREDYDQIASESKSMRMTLTQTQRDEYKKIGAQSNDESSAELRMQRLRTILTKEQFDRFNSLFNRAISNARLWKDYHAAGSSLSKEYASVSQAMETTSLNDKQASQARWRNMWQDYTQQQQHQQDQDNWIMLEDSLK